MEKIKIVLIEDEFVVSEHISSGLTEEGFDVIGVFDNAENALDFILQHPPDLLLVDIMLSGEMNGIELVKKVREHHDIPIIYITANSDNQTYEKAKFTQPQAFLIKPFSEDNLYRAIDLAILNFSAGKMAERISRNLPEIEKKEEDQVLIHNRLFIRSSGKYIKIKPDDILFIEASGSYVYIQLQGSRYTLSQNLSTFFKKSHLSNLVRIHRSYLININKVDAFDESCVFIGTHKLPMGDHYKEEFHTRINRI